MKLVQATPGLFYRIRRIGDPWLRDQALRFGIGEGAVIHCDYVLTKGPVIISRYRKQLAIGHELARKIEVAYHLDGVANCAQVFPVEMDRVGGKSQCR